MRKTYALADLHGRFDLLCRALSLIEADAGESGGTLVVTGDFVDRGPQAKSIIDLLMAGPTLPNWKWIVLQGNHETMMLEVLANPEPGQLRWWFGNGGGQTLKSYGYSERDALLPLKVPEAHLDWLANLPVWHEDNLRIFVHAGVPHDKHIGDVKKEILQWVLHEGDIEGVSGIPDAPNISGKHIVHGHHQDAKHPLRLPHRTNLDSYAWATGHLAIGVFDDSQAGPIKIMDAIGRPDPRYSELAWS